VQVPGLQNAPVGVVGDLAVLETPVQRHRQRDERVAVADRLQDGHQRELRKIELAFHHGLEVIVGDATLGELQEVELHAVALHLALFQRHRVGVIAEHGVESYGFLDRAHGFGLLG
jgi:hypothetical protein